MNTSNEPNGSEPGHEPSGSPPEPPNIPPLLLPPEERLRRVAATLDALSDALQSDAEYSTHFTGRSLVCEMLHDEVQAVTRDLEGGAA
ncbi:MAG: hypothetical protein JST22_09930 [Bacteroidetes bacterium]|nr:hypothetical protein [Bacteroidota bacterium]